MPTQMYNRLIMLVGLPRSGKTTWAKRHNQAHGWPVVNPDAIRLAMHGEAGIRSAERLVMAAAELQVRSHFAYGHECVILDAANTTRAQREWWSSSAYLRFFVPLTATPEECLKRAGDEVGLYRVIREMAAKFEPLEIDEEILI